MGTIMLSGSAVVVAVMAILVAVAAIRRIEAVPEPRSEPAPVVQEPELPSMLVEMSAKLAALEITVAGLPSLWEEERKRATRSYAAARAARSKLDAELEESDDELDPGDDVFPIHAAGGDQRELLALHEGVEAPSLEDITRSAVAQGLI